MTYLSLELLHEREGSRNIRVKTVVAFLAFRNVLSKQSNERRLNFQAVRALFYTLHS